VTNIPDPLTPPPLPAASSRELKYNGAYTEGVEYGGGDIIIGPDNRPYLCVGDTGDPPSGWFFPDPRSTPPIGYSTEFPKIAVNGQLVILVDSLTKPTFHWQFRYNAYSEYEHKWEFIGGSGKLVGPDGSVLINAGAFMDIPGINMTVPRSGDYQIQSYCTAQNNNEPHDGYGAIFRINGSKSRLDLITWRQVIGAAHLVSGTSSVISPITLLEGERISIQGSTTKAISTYFGPASILLTPVRVS
jgi:hypothetical protein